MDIGDRVKLISCIPFNATGVIWSKVQIPKFRNIKEEPSDINNLEWNYYIKADDDNDFSGFENELEKINND